MTFNLYFVFQFVRLKELGYTAEEVNKCASLLSTHAVRMTLSDGGEGRGMFPTFAFMSHSCDPNARHVIKDGKIHVIAQRLIKAGQEVTITYTSLLTSLPRRQDKLAALWFFTCTCNR